MSTSLNQEVLERIRAEYLEMPGLRLTVEQVQRLCGIERAMCRVALETLVEAKFLCTKSNGVYARLTDGDIPRPAKADLERKTVMHMSPMGNAHVTDRTRGRRCWSGSVPGSRR
jgi:hypothetical protein